MCRNAGEALQTLKTGQGAIIGDFEAPNAGEVVQPLQTGQSIPADRETLNAGEALQALQAGQGATKVDRQVDPLRW